MNSRAVILSVTSGVTVYHKSIGSQQFCQRSLSKSRAVYCGGDAVVPRGLHNKMKGVGIKQQRMGQFLLLKVSASRILQ